MTYLSEFCYLLAALTITKNMIYSGNMAINSDQENKSSYLLLK